MIRPSRVKPFQPTLKVLLFFTATCFATLPAHCQQAQLDALAARTVQTLNKAHVKSAVVAGFWNSKKQVTKLCSVLADQFSAAMGSSSAKFEVLERTRLDKLLGDEGLSEQTVENFDVAQWIAKTLGAKAIVLGEVGREGEQFHLTVSIFKTSNGKNLGNFDVTLPGGPDWSSLIDEPRAEDSSFSAPEAGKNGFTNPDCLYCPTPPFTDAAFAHKAQGVVVLDVVISANGTATDICVNRGMPYGLTLSAIRQIKKWQFKPALGPDGKPATVHTLVEVDFNIH